VDENSATTESDIKETLKRLMHQLKKSSLEVFNALKNQSAALILTLCTRAMQFVHNEFCIPLS
jgi:phosphoenolpyruvate carboxylase